MTGIRLRGITWDHERGLGPLVATAGSFREVRPDIEVEWSVRSLQAFADQPVDQLAGQFDLLVVDHPAIGYAVGRGCLVPLDEHLDPSFLADQSAASVGRSHESYLWDGHHWALATDAAAQVGSYRPDLLGRLEDRPPRTWDEVFALAHTARRAGLSMAIPLIPVDAVCAFLGICWGLGGEPLGRGGSVVDREIGLAALELLTRLRAVAHPMSLEWNPPRTYERMASTDEIVYCPLAFGYSNYARPGFRDRALRFTAPPAGGGRPGGTLGGAGLALSAGCGEPEAAISYLSYVASSEIQRTVYVEAGGQPGHRAAWTDPAANAACLDFFEDTLEAMDRAYLRPRYDGFLDFQRGAGLAIHAFLRYGGEAERLLGTLDASYRASLGEGV